VVNSPNIGQRKDKQIKSESKQKQAFKPPFEVMPPMAPDKPIEPERTEQDKGVGGGWLKKCFRCVIGR
jgi:hypothetical protein